jgi:WD40 repeat protein
VIFTLSVDGISLQSVVQEDRQFLFREIADSITSIAVNPVKDRILVCITNTSQILKVGANREPRALIYDFHSKSITGMDVCVTKPLIATCSKDNSIKVWNYMERRMEITFKHPDVEPVSIAFHPNSLYLVVGCINKLYLMSVCLTTLKITQEIGVKQFKDMALSHSGQYLALSHAGMLQVFNFYTMGIVSGYTISPVRVQTISWYDDDSGFITTDQKNRVSFCLLDSHPMNIPINSKQVISGVVKVPGAPLAFAACSDYTIKEVTEDTVSKRMDLSEVPGQVAISKGLEYFFIGIEDENKPGSVRCYKYPMNANEYTNIPAHAKEVRKMKVSPSGRHLFTAGEDGCLILYAISERNRTQGYIEYSKEVLTDRQQLNELQQRLEELQKKRKKLKKPRTSKEDV